MTGEEILYSIQSFFMEKGIKKELSLNQFNLYYKMANIEFFRTKVGFLKEKEGIETREQISDALRKFIIFPDTAIIVSSDKAELPADYKHRLGAWYVDENVPYKIDLVTAEEFAERESNKNSQPSSDNPIAVICKYDTGYYMIVRPESTISGVYLLYLKQPTNPLVALKLENGIMVYDSGNSTEIEWDEEYHVDIIRLILKYLGVPETDLVAFSKTEQTEQN